MLLIPAGVAGAIVCRCGAGGRGRPAHGAGAAPGCGLQLTHERLHQQAAGLQHRVRVHGSGLRGWAWGACGACWGLWAARAAGPCAPRDGPRVCALRLAGCWAGKVGRKSAHLRPALTSATATANNPTPPPHPTQPGHHPEHSAGRRLPHGLHQRLHSHAPPGQGGAPPAGGQPRWAHCARVCRAGAAGAAGGKGAAVAPAMAVECLWQALSHRALNASLPPAVPFGRPQTCCSLCWGTRCTGSC